MKQLRRYLLRKRVVARRVVFRVRQLSLVQAALAVIIAILLFAWNTGSILSICLIVIVALKLKLRLLALAVVVCAIYLAFFPLHAQRGQTSELTDSVVHLLPPLEHVRNEIIRDIRQSLPEPRSSLLIGILIGNKTVKLPKALDQDLKLSGLGHIASISGYNVNIVVAGLVGFAGLLNRRKLSLLLMPALIVFLLFIGFDNLPAQRAVFSGLLSLLATCTGRPADKWSILLLTLAVMLIIDPSAANSVSLWLSVTAYLGVNCFTGYWYSIQPNFSNLVKEILSSTLGVYTVSVPIFITIFGSVSLTGLVANLLALPLVPPVTFLGMAGIATDHILPVLGQALFWMCDVLLQLIVTVSKLGKALPFMNVDDPRLGWICWVVLAAIVILIDFKMTLNAKLA